MGLTHISLKLDIEHYNYLAEIARQDFNGNLSELIRSRLPKKQTIKDYLAEQQNGNNK